MKVIEHIDRITNPVFSYEIVPPPRGKSAREIIEIAETLSEFRPPWIDVTSHASSAYFNERPDGTIEKRTFKKRPGTLAICGIIQNRFKIDTVAHVLCKGFTREETEDALIELNFLGIENVLALQGDHLNHTKEVSKNRTVNQYARDLVEQMAELRDGKYLDEQSNSSAMDFCVGVAGYPEKHFEAANRKTDLMHLKGKVEAGAHFITTQMFFDNDQYFKFKSDCREMGIHVPIIPGLKIFTKLNQLKTLPKTFHIDLPDPLVDEAVENPTHVREIGQRWARKQVEELLNRGEKCIHFYILNDTSDVVDIVKYFRKQL